MAILQILEVYMDTQQELLQELLEQERTIQFPSFSNETALEVGLALLKAAQDQGKSLTIDITRHGHQLFHYAMSGTTADNDEWIRRKSNVAKRFGHSSFYVGTYLATVGKTIEERYFVSPQEYVPHGGSFPLIIRGTGIIGTITVSGLPQKEDHEFLTSTLKQFLKEHFN
jgi:uncharacterized protein (UPF0303 family)